MPFKNNYTTLIESLAIIAIVKCENILFEVIISFINNHSSAFHFKLKGGLYDKHENILEKDKSKPATKFAPSYSQLEHVRF
jgi:hypothetical protein